MTRPMLRRLSTKTVYRDVDLLRELGVEIEARMAYGHPGGFRITEKCVCPFCAT